MAKRHAEDIPPRKNATWKERYDGLEQVMGENAGGQAAQAAEREDKRITIVFDRPGLKPDGPSPALKARRHRPLQEVAGQDRKAAP
ncbi:hypothetical protein [Nitrospirillum iridis]|uniref:Uncharacterized protein n=1 Tax=Nitrospirillum iridis TaxID=765888 RepID=A0A7X0AU85_9PROT|nr:hypothetical protein [Nitrospirillum iridis]MBB6250193.1 hypothetical protein [Nitrospirillum iridis]